MLINSIKNILKKIFPFTSNIRYDKETYQIMKLVLNENSTFLLMAFRLVELLNMTLKSYPNYNLDFYHILLVRVFIRINKVFFTFRRLV